MNINAPAHGGCYEEEYLGFDIFVVSNPDKWNEGFIWSICKDGEEIDTGFEFGFDDAVVVAKDAIKFISSRLNTFTVHSYYKN